jgi:hypothetical protein
MQAQDNRGALDSLDAPARLIEHLDDMCPLEFLESETRRT